MSDSNNFALDDDDNEVSRLLCSTAISLGSDDSDNKNGRELTGWKEEDPQSYYRSLKSLKRHEICFVLFLLLLVENLCALNMISEVSSTLTLFIEAGDGSTTSYFIVSEKRKMFWFFLAAYELCQIVRLWILFTQHHHFGQYVLRFFVFYVFCLYMSWYIFIASTIPS